MTTPGFGPAPVIAGATTLFQPIVALATRTVVGYEALSRLADGSAPLDVLAASEAVGRREDDELHLIATAVQASAALPASAFVTINACGTTMLRPELDDLLRGLDRPWGLELYEGATTADLGAIRARVTELGGRLLVDDAGAGAADETRIAALRPDNVKIDRMLFWRAEEDDTARDRLESLIAAARAVEATVLVEGVDSEARLAAAAAFGATYAQGFHLGRPTPPAEIDALLRDLERRVGVDAAGL